MLGVCISWRGCFSVSEHNVSWSLIAKIEVWIFSLPVVFDAVLWDHLCQPLLRLQCRWCVSRADPLHLKDQGEMWELRLQLFYLLLSGRILDVYEGTMSLWTFHLTGFLVYTSLKVTRVWQKSGIICSDFSQEYWWHFFNGSYHILFPMLIFI